MVSSTYSSGSWIGIVRSGSVIALERHTDPAIVTQLWDYLAQAPTLHGVLNEITEAFGTGLTNLPPFAILVQSDRLHAILRGDMDLVSSSDEGTETVSGRDVTTWSERSLPLPHAFMLTLGPVDETGEFDVDGYGYGLDLPVSEAVVCLQSLTVATDDDAVEDIYPGEYDPEEDFVEDFVEDFDTEELADQEPSTAEYDDGMALLTPVEAPAEIAGYAEADEADAAEEAAPEDAEDEDAYAEFAMAAEAADAEWNAQLAPVARLDAQAAQELAAETVDDGIGLESPETDMNLTIRPYEHEEDEETEEVAEAAEAAGLEGLAEVEEAEEPAAAESDEEAETGTDLGTGEAAPAADDAVDDGFTINYDFLFGATVAKSVEAAAVRLETDEDQQVPAPSEPVMPPMPSAPPLAGSGGASAHQEADTHSVPETPSPESGSEELMIDSVPWASQDVAAETPAAGVPTSDAAGTGRTEQAVQSEQAAQSASDASYDPDHDGHTVMRSDFQSTQEGAAPLESRPPTGPMVLARMCPNGHANPPSRATCWSCGTGINAEPREVGRPRLGTMHISTGEVVELDHSLIIGRQPSVSRVMGGAMPRLVQVKSSNGDISRSHVEVRLDGWDVLLVDLKATNGTVLVREGQAPRRLSQGEEAILLNGDIAELGDGVSLLFDGLL